MLGSCHVFSLQIALKKKNPTVTQLFSFFFKIGLIKAMQDVHNFINENGEFVS